MNSVFHEGELKAQRLAGEEITAGRNSAMIGKAVPRGAVAFLAQQQLLVAAYRDGEGRMWAAPLTGAPGIATADDPHLVRLRVRSEQLPESRVGLLAIDLATRRRLRVNGMARRTGPDEVTVAVDEAFPNCPKYIQRRRLVMSQPHSEPARATTGAALSPEEIAIVKNADTMFVASHHPERGADASHRGGKPGFVRVLNGITLQIPDYSGNGLFNTLGNLLVDPAAGLLFLDFDNSRALQLTGRAEVHFDGERRWDFHVERWIASPLPRALSWEFIEASPYNPA